MALALVFVSENSRLFDSWNPLFRMYGESAIRRKRSVVTTPHVTVLNEKKRGSIVRVLLLNRRPPFSLSRALTLSGSRIRQLVDLGAIQALCQMLGRADAKVKWIFPFFKPRNTDTEKYQVWNPLHSLASIQWIALISCLEANLPFIAISIDRRNFVPRSPSKRRFPTPSWRCTLSATTTNR